jgi:uncharacterized membrane protein
MIDNYYIFIITTISIILIDSIYLSLISSTFSKMIYNIQKSPLKINILSAFFAYLSMSLGLYYFIIKQQKNIYDSAILGFIIYSIYEFTNKSLIKKWNWNIVIIDSLWGSVLFSLTTLIVYSLI